MDSLIYCFHCDATQPVVIRVRRVIVGVVVTPDPPLTVADVVCTACGTVYERQPAPELAHVTTARDLL